MSHGKERVGGLPRGPPPCLRPLFQVYLPSLDSRIMITISHLKSSHVLILLSKKEDLCTVTTDNASSASARGRTGSHADDSMGKVSWRL